MAMTFIGCTLADANGIILAVDGAVADLLHRPEREIVGRSYLDFTHSADHVQNRSQVTGLQSSGSPRVISKRYLRPDGTIVPIDLGVSCLGGSADAGRLVGSLHHRREWRPRRTPDILWRTARRLLRLETMRQGEFGLELFGDRAWSILLAIYVAEAEGGIADIPALAEDLRQTVDVALRWARAMRAAGLIECADREGRVWELTGEGVGRLERLLASVQED